MSANKQQRVDATRAAANLMLGAAMGERSVKRRLRTPWNHNNYKFVTLARLPYRWNWTKFEYILGDDHKDILS